MYDILLTREAEKFYMEAKPQFLRRLHRCLEHLRENPSDHPNSRSLRGPLAGSFQYRLGNWRIVYKVDEKRKVVCILPIVHRSKAYT